MNPAIGKSQTAGEVRSWLPRLFACGLLVCSLAGWSADQKRTAPDFTAHEWGTFTAIAGKDGRAVEWSRGTGPERSKSGRHHAEPKPEPSGNAAPGYGTDLSRP